MRRMEGDNKKKEPPQRFFFYTSPPSMKEKSCCIGITVFCVNMRWGEEKKKIPPNAAAARGSGETVADAVRLQGDRWETKCIL